MLRYRLILVFSLCLLGVVVMGLPAPALAAEAAVDNISGTDSGVMVMNTPQAAASVLIEAHTGEIIFGLNEDNALPPASTTKILTALLALDMDADLDKPHLVSAAAAAVEESSLYLCAGESLSLADLLKGALVHSGNDACYAIGEAIAGSEQLFVHWMNMKAAVLGAYSVNMENTNGLPAAAHQMSAADLALLTSYAMMNDFFAETVSSKYVEIGEGSSYRYYKNTNKLLWQDEHIVGVKTGTTDAAGPCLVAAYEDGAALFLSVVFNSPDRYGESLSLLKYGADEYMLIYLPCQDEDLAYLPTEDGGILLRAERDLQALIKTEQLTDISLVWQFDAQGGTLALVNEAGEELAATDLSLVAEAGE